jgi:hypothetical protein
MKHDYKRGTSEGRGGKEKILSWRGSKYIDKWKIHMKPTHKKISKW